jgi:hypothetical protein
MSVYSGTFAPAPDHAGFALKDPIAEAREMLRLAARFPFAATRPGAWQSGFRKHTANAHKALREHIIRADLPDSPISQIEREAPQLRPIVLQQRDEHEPLLRQADELLELVTRSGTADIWQMIDLGEKAILIEMALARHHNRLMRLASEFEPAPKPLG